MCFGPCVFYVTVEIGCLGLCRLRDGNSSILIISWRGCVVGHAASQGILPFAVISSFPKSFVNRPIRHKEREMSTPHPSGTTLCSLSFHPLSYATARHGPLDVDAAPIAAQQQQPFSTAALATGSSSPKPKAQPHQGKWGTKGTTASKSAKAETTAVGSSDAPAADAKPQRPSFQAANAGDVPPAIGPSLKDMLSGCVYIWTACNHRVCGHCLKEEIARQTLSLPSPHAATLVADRSDEQSRGSATLLLTLRCGLCPAASPGPDQQHRPVRLFPSSSDGKPPTAAAESFRNRVAELLISATAVPLAPPAVAVGDEGGGGGGGGGSPSSHSLSSFATYQSWRVDVLESAPLQAVVRLHHAQYPLLVTELHNATSSSSPNASAMIARSESLKKMDGSQDRGGTGGPRDDALSHRGASQPALGSVAQEDRQCGICEASFASASQSSTTVVAGYCVQCGFLVCKECANTIHAKGKFKRHEVMAEMKSSSAGASGRTTTIGTNPADIGGGIKSDTTNNNAKTVAANCSVHERYPIELYCGTCQTAICLMCHYSGDHRGHDVTDLKELRKQLDAKLIEVGQRIRGRVAALDYLRSRGRTMMPIVSATGDGYLAAIRCFCENIREHLSTFETSAALHWGAAKRQIEQQWAIDEAALSSALGAFQTIEEGIMSSLMLPLPSPRPDRDEKASSTAAADSVSAVSVSSSVSTAELVALVPAILQRCRDVESAPLARLTSTLIDGCSSDAPTDANSSSSVPPSWQRICESLLPPPAEWATITLRGRDVSTALHQQLSAGALPSASDTLTAYGEALWTELLRQPALAPLSGGSAHVFFPSGGIGFMPQWHVRLRRSAAVGGTHLSVLVEVAERLISQTERQRSGQLPADFASSLGVLPSELVESRPLCLPDNSPQLMLSAPSPSPWFPPIAASSSGRTDAVAATALLASPQSSGVAHPSAPRQRVVAAATNGPHMEPFAAAPPAVPSRPTTMVISTGSGGAVTPTTGATGVFLARLFREDRTTGTVATPSAPGAAEKPPATAAGTGGSNGGGDFPTLTQFSSTQFMASTTADARHHHHALGGATGYQPVSISLAQGTTGRPRSHTPSVRRDDLSSETTTTSSIFSKDKKRTRSPQRTAVASSSSPSRAARLSYPHRQGNDDDDDEGGGQRRDGDDHNATLSDLLSSRGGGAGARERAAGRGSVAARADEGAQALRRGVDGDQEEEHSDDADVSRSLHGGGGTAGHRGGRSAAEKRGRGRPTTGLDDEGAGHHDEQPHDPTHDPSSADNSAGGVGPPKQQAILNSGVANRKGAATSDPLKAFTSSAAVAPPPSKTRFVLRI